MKKVVPKTDFNYQKETLLDIKAAINKQFNNSFFPHNRNGIPIMVDILLLIIEVGTNRKFAETQCGNTFHIIESSKIHLRHLLWIMAIKLVRMKKKIKDEEKEGKMLYYILVFSYSIVSILIITYRLIYKI